MRITIIAVGELKEKYLVAGVKEYLKRLSSYAKVKIIEIRDEKAPDNASPAQEEAVKDTEGRKILSKIKDDAHVIALAISGQMLSSEGLATYLDKLMLHGQSHVTFLIGGSLGLSQDVLARADFQLSFSPMTFPHQLMRLILLEQIYRSFKIIRGETYHK